MMLIVINNVCTMVIHLVIGIINLTVVFHQFLAFLLDDLSTVIISRKLTRTESHQTIVRIKNNGKIDTYTIGLSFFATAPDRRFVCIANVMENKPYNIKTFFLLLMSMIGLSMVMVCIFGIGFRSKKGE